MRCAQRPERRRVVVARRRGWVPAARRAIASWSLASVALLVACIAAWPGPVVAAVARYEVSVDAPGDLKTLIESNLSLIRWRDADGKRGHIDEDQLRRLFDQGRDEIQRLIATEGYYHATIDADLVQEGDHWVARYHVTPNAAATVESVDLSFVGPITEAKPGQPPDVDALKAAWSLRVGDVFKQPDWEGSKRRLLQGLLLKTYPFATITRSKAQVDVTTDKVKLEVVVASGPAVRFGPLQITGLDRYPESLVHNLNPTDTGELYSQDQLFEFQRRLSSSGYFSRTEVSIDAVADPGTDPRSPFVKPDESTSITTPATDNAPATPLPAEVTLPIRVLVEENKSKTVSVGLGYSTNSGPRASAGYNIINFLGGAKQLRNTLSVDSLKQQLGTDLIFPTTPDGSRYSISSNVRREDVQNEVTRGVGLSGKRAWGPQTTERYTSVDYIYEQKTVSDVPQIATQTLSTSYGVTLRRTDNLLSPTTGYLANAVVTGGIRLTTGQPFARVYGRGLRYLPINEHNTLILRVELGAIAGKSTETLPSTLLFRAGGDGSVRGYGYQSLGVAQSDATVGGRYVATGTVEGIHWLGPRLPDWGVALFMDAGNAGNRFTDLKPVYGYGTGVRWRSPVGALDFDVARGIENHSTRLHFSLGVTF